MCQYIDFYLQMILFFLFAVLIGYEYQLCKDVVWKTLLTTIQGHNPAVTSLVGPWTLNIHHTYHPDKGTLHLGSGGEMRLNEQPPMMSTVMGNGISRTDACYRCNGK